MNAWLALALMGVAQPACAQVVSPLSYGNVADLTGYDTVIARQAATATTEAKIPSVTGLATTASVTSAISSATSGLATVSAMTAMGATIPTAATSTPPAVTDTGTIGTSTTQYALANHTHASKARKGIVTTAADGTVTVTFGTPFTTGVVPVCVAQAVPTAGTTDVINVQGDGDPTATASAFRVTRTQRSVVALIGLTVLSLPASPGATKIHYICLEP